MRVGELEKLSRSFQTLLLFGERIGQSERPLRTVVAKKLARRETARIQPAINLASASRVPAAVNESDRERYSHAQDY